jgi:Transglutaminase-like superfamily
MNHPNVRALTYPLAPGNLGIAQTIMTMQQLRDLGSQDASVRQRVFEILRAYNVNSRDRYATAHAILSWVKANITFVPDPAGRELIGHPSYLLDVRAGDCDDMAVLTAAMLQAVGIPAQFVTIRADAQEPARHSHVYLRAFINGRWMGLDPSVAASSVGWEPPVHFGKPAAWGSMADKKGLGQAIPQMSPTPSFLLDIPSASSLQPPSSSPNWQSTLQNIAQEFAAAGASRLAYGQAGGTAVATTKELTAGGLPGASITGPGGLSVLGANWSSWLMFGGLALLAVALLKRK